MLSLKMILNWGAALLAMLIALLDELLFRAMEPALRQVGAVGDLSEIRLMTDLGHEGRAYSKGDIVKVGTGKDAIAPKVALAWLRAGLGIRTSDPENAVPTQAARSTVVVHERGGQELLQSVTSVTSEGHRKGPAPENPTDSDPEEDAEAGRARTAAGAVIEENADPETLTDPPEKAGKKSAKKK